MVKKRKTKKKIVIKKKIVKQEPIPEAKKLDSPIKAHIVGDKVFVEEDYERFLPFYDRSSFGEIHGVKSKRIELGLSEALYLMEREKIEVYSVSSKPLTLQGFARMSAKMEQNFWTRYRVYRDLRTRGYILKTALKFGADFRVYRRGIKPGQDHAKWVLFAAQENAGLTWRQFSAMNRVAHSTRKKLLVGLVDDEGDVTYYEIRWKKP